MAAAWPQADRVDRAASPVFVGRRAELGRLTAALEHAESGKPTFAILGGDAGVGKTRLVQELTRLASERGALVMQGGCVSLSAETAPFAPIVEALRGLRGRLGAAELDEVLGSKRSSLAALLPAAAERGAVGEATGVSPETGASRLYEHFLGLLTRASELAPVVFIIEDIHWADVSTIDLLSFLTRNLAEQRFLLALTLRTDERAGRDQLLQFLAELERQRHVIRLALEPFDRAEVSEQLSSILGRPADPALVDQIYARSQGNAFLTEELLAAGPLEAGAIPDTLRDVLDARLGALSPPAERLVQVASAAGGKFSQQMLAAMSAGEDIDIDRALREALRHRILVWQSGADPDWLAFRHALVQERVHETLLPGERAEFHGAAARALESQPAASSNAVVAAEIAYHWYMAKDVERALDAAIEAGLASEAAGARSEARTQFERALSLLDRGSSADAVRLDRIQLHERAAANAQAEPERAVAHIRTALRLVDPTRQPERAGLLQSVLGRYLWMAGDGAGSLAACREAVRMVPRDPPTRARGRVTAGMGQLLMLLADPEAAAPLCREAIELASRLRDRPIEGHALNTLGFATAYLGDVDEGLRLLYQARDIAGERRLEDDVGRAYVNIVEVLIQAAARFDEAHELGGSVVKSADELKPTGLLAAMALGEAATACYLAGRWDEVVPLVRRALLQPVQGVAELEFRLPEVRLQVGRGQFQEADLLLATIDQLLARSAGTQWIAEATDARAELELWRHNPQRALEVITRTLRRIPTIQGAFVSRVGPLYSLGVRAAADVAAQRRQHRSTGDIHQIVDAGRQHLAAMLDARDEIAARWPAHGRLAAPWAQLCQAEGSRLEGHSDPDAFSMAADRLLALGLPYPHAYARFREGEGRLVVRQTARARAALQEAHEQSTALGATPLTALIEATAKRGRVDLGRDARTASLPASPKGLTPREQEVLRLLTRGHTDRQIGEALYITEKTASHHVSNILAKLEVRSRAAAATEAARLGLLDPSD